MLRIYSVALDVCRDASRIAKQIEKHDSSLANQLRRCASSIPLNIGEGSGSFGGNRKLRYHSALGSSSEVSLVAPRNLAVTIPAGLVSGGATSMKIRYNGPLVAPIAKGQEVAQLVVTTGDTPPQVVPLVAGEDVGKAGFFARIWLGLKSLFGMA